MNILDPFYVSKLFFVPFSLGDIVSKNNLHNNLTMV